ncbi:cyclase family protein, partial [Klebsiella pneumoniae]|uniref:cyclase family protein n=1 Tax=Klebsiella pneumoniae TaxID=573 RepID=UPI00272FE1EC
MGLKRFCKPAYGIDELPLDWCLRPVVKLDFRHLPDGHVVTAAEIETELKRIEYVLQPLDIVLVNTDWKGQQPVDIDRVV